MRKTILMLTLASVFVLPFVFSWCFLGLGTTCEGEEEIHRIYDINNVEYNKCLNNKSLTNEDGDLVEDEEERLEVCSPLERITEMVYEIETEGGILRASNSPTCYWGDEDKDGKPDDYKFCYTELECISKGELLEIDSLGTHFQKDLVSDIIITVDKLTVMIGEPVKVNYTFNYPVGAGKETYNISINFGGKDYTLR